MREMELLLCEEELRRLQLESSYSCGNGSSREKIRGREGLMGWKLLSKDVSHLQAWALSPVQQDSAPKQNIPRMNLDKPDLD